MEKLLTRLVDARKDNKGLYHEFAEEASEAAILSLMEGILWQENEGLFGDQLVHRRKGEIFMGQKRKSISMVVRNAIIEKYGTKCFYCRKEGMILNNRRGVVVEKEPVKKYENIYDGTFHLVHRAFHFDHIIPVIKGGNNDFENIVISCPLCNRRKGAK